MAVEILILSGVRQGERLVLDAREFRAGSDPACEILFDASRDLAVHGRSAIFRLLEDGWRLRCAGGEAFVNQQPVAGWTHVRSGDVVRMSDSGPDFSFGIVAGEATSPARQPAGGLASNSPGESVPSSGCVAAVDVVELAKQSDVVDAATPGNGTVLFSADGHRNSRPTIPANAGRPWVIWAAGGLAIGIVTLILVRSALFPPTVVVNVNQPVIPTASVNAPATPTNLASGQDDEQAEEVRGSELRKIAGKKPQTSEEPKSTGGTVDIATQLEGAVFLLQVEKSGRSWPFATGVAIADDTLLTSAREAVQLAKWQAEGGFKIWATRPADGFKVEVQDFRINGIYASLAEKPNDWIYYDSGLLRVRAKLPKVAPLASAEELAALEEGLPVVCFGFTHEGEKTTRFDKFEPRLTQGKIYVVTVSQDLPGRPRLLHVKAEIPKNAYGSPIVTGEGKVIGVYGEAAIPPSGEQTRSDGIGLRNMHYATVVHLEMINLWLRDRSAKIWLPAVARRALEPTQDEP